MLVSQHFPAWYLGTHPDRRVILCAYEHEFAASWGRKAKDVIEEHGEKIFGVALRRDSAASHRWDLLGRTGGMVTAGCGGPVTGKGADLLILDDLIKNSQEALSQTVRDSIWEWFVSSAYTRLEPGGAVVGIGTRWSVDDWIGRLLQLEKEGGEKWDFIDLPALAEENDALGRMPGESLWPERWPIAELENIRQTQGAWWFNCLYQGRPMLPGGNHFQRGWFRWYEELSDRYILDNGEEIPKHHPHLIRFGCCDPASSEKDSADYTAMGAFLAAPDNNLLILEVERERIALEQIAKHALRMCHRHNLSRFGCEATGFQTSVVNQMRKLAGMPPVMEMSHEGKGKLVRAQPAMVMCEAGQVFLPIDGPWVEPFIEECCAFTGDGDRFDDQVDMFSYGVRMLRDMFHDTPQCIEVPFSDLEERMHGNRGTMMRELFAPWYHNRGIYN
jgi:predicted phage terminase large subunit-like protein